MASLPSRRALAADPGWQVRVLLETEPWIAVGFRLAVAELLETAREHEVRGTSRSRPARARLGCRRGAAPSHAPTGPADRRCASRPARDRRSRQRVEERALLPARLDPWMPVGRVVAARAARRAREGAVRGEPDDGQPDHHRRPAAGTDALGLRPWRPAVSPLRHAHPGARGRASPERVTYWCPACQPAHPGVTFRRHSGTGRRPTRYPVSREPSGTLGHDPLPVDRLLRRLARLGLRRLRRAAVQLRRAGVRAAAARRRGRRSRRAAARDRRHRHRHLGAPGRLGDGRHPLRPGHRPPRSRAHPPADDHDLCRAPPPPARWRPTSGRSPGCASSPASASAASGPRARRSSPRWCRRARRVAAGALLYTSAPVGILLAGFVTDLLTKRDRPCSRRSPIWRGGSSSSPASCRPRSRRGFAAASRSRRSGGASAAEHPRLRELFAPGAAARDARRARHVPGHAGHMVGDERVPAVRRRAPRRSRSGNRRGRAWHRGLATLLFTAGGLPRDASPPSRSRASDAVRCSPSTWPAPRSRSG